MYKASRQQIEITNEINVPPRVANRNPQVNIQDSPQEVFLFHMIPKDPSSGAKNKRKYYCNKMALNGRHNYLFIRCHYIRTN